MATFHRLPNDSTLTHSAPRNNSTSHKLQSHTELLLSSSYWSMFAMLTSHWLIIHPLLLLPGNLIGSVCCLLSLYCQPVKLANICKTICLQFSSASPFKTNSVIFNIRIKCECYSRSVVYPLHYMLYPLNNIILRTLIRQENLLSNWADV